MEDLRDAIVELERELQVRRNVYPRLILNGKLTRGEADRRMKALRCALYCLQHALDTAQPTHIPTTTE